MKKAFVAIVIMASAYATQAAYVYWQLANELCQRYTFSYATISQGGEELVIWNEGGSTGFTELYRVGGEGAYTAGPVYSKLSDPTLTDGLVVNLYNGDGESVFDTEIDHSEWSKYVYGDMTMVGAEPLVVNIPEPTGGMLVMLGVGLLALRRKRYGKGAAVRRMLAVSAALLAAGNVLAAANDTLISFSTKGPDAYADGTTVRDGECYALVWTRTGKTFEGIAADGAVVGDGSEVLVFAPAARNGHCPPVVFELDAELAERYTGGTFGVYLLDTRLANGTLGGIDAKGVPVAVNGYGKVEAGLRNGAASATSSSGIASITAARSVSSATASADPANAPKPQITAIRIVGDRVFLTVKNTLRCMKYAAREVELGKDTVVQSSSADLPSATDGAASVDDEITIIAPKNGSSGFYSVQRD